MIPSAYLAGYEKARAQDPETAANYIAHTTLGDPEADAAVEALASLSQRESAQLIQALMDQQPGILRDAPEPLRELFERLETPPRGLTLRQSTLAVAPSKPTQISL